MDISYQAVMNNLIIAAVLLVVAGVVIIPLLRRQNTWEKLAARTGLVFTPGKFIGKSAELSGLYRGFTLRLYIELRGNSDASARSVYL